MRDPRPGVGNLFRSGYQNQLKSMAKIFRVPTCFALQMSVKSKKKRYSRYQMSFSAKNIGEKRNTPHPLSITELALTHF